MPIAHPDPPASTFLSRARATHGRQYGAVVLVLLTLAASALAATNSAKFGVTATVAASCTIVIRPRLLAAADAASTASSAVCAATSGGADIARQAISRLVHDPASSVPILMIEF